MEHIRIKVNYEEGEEEFVFEELEALMDAKGVDYEYDSGGRIIIDRVSLDDFSALCAYDFDVI